MRKEKKQIYSFILTIFISLLILLPWTIRNYQVFGRFLLVNTSGGELFWMGTLEETDGKALGYDDPRWLVYDHFSNPVIREHFFFNKGVKNILSKPLLFVKLSFKKFIRLWFQPVGQVLTARKFPTIGLFLYFSQALLIFFSLLGIIENFKKLDIFLPVFMLFIYFTIMHNLIPPIPRYRLPVEPFLIVFALAGISSLISIWVKIRNKNVLE